VKGISNPFSIDMACPRSRVDFHLPVFVDGIVERVVNAGVAAVFRFVGIEEELVCFLAVWSDGVAGVGFVWGEVDDEDQVGALSDEDLVFMIDVEELGGGGLEDVAIFQECDEIAIPRGEPMVFQLRVI
jgi:hypothetical protein